MATDNKLARFLLFTKSRLKKFVKKNFKYSIYPSRIFVVIVWCLVLWSFLGEDSLPATTAGRSDGCEMAVSNYSNIPVDELRETVLSITKNSYILSFYHPIGAVAIDDYSYRILLIDKRLECDIRNVQSVTVYGEIGDLHILNESDFLYQFNFTYDDNPVTSSLFYIPTGHIFALVVLGIVSALFGFIVKFCCIPPLVGMIIAGFMLRNLPIVLIGQISPVWSSTIRNIALVIVLVRGGLALSFKQLNQIKFAFLFLSFVPCVLEGCLDGIIATFYLNLPWQWGFLLGFVVAAISPAVVVPTTLVLQEKMYGVAKGIPTLVIGAASFDVVISISLFGIFLGLAFSEGNLLLDIFRAPIQIIIGLLYGVLLGIVLWIIPVPLKYNVTKSYRERSRFMLLFGLSLFAVFGSRRAIIGGSSLAGSGPLAVVILAFIAGLKWTSDEKKRVSRIFYLMWQVAQPFLFGLIGAELDIRFISPSLVGQAFLLLLCGLVLRISSSILVVTGNNFSWKEKLFIAVSWLPKATVQAAVGSIALDSALARNDSEEDISRGRTVLTIAVLAIFLTAPLGGVAISLLGPILLSKKVETENKEVDEQVSPQDIEQCHNKVDNIPSVKAPVETTV